MVVVIVVAALAVLALVTQAGVWLAQQAHPARGRMIEVAGGTMPAVAVHVDAAAERGHALVRQPRTLLAIRARAGGKGNATASRDHTVPGDRAVGGQA